MMRLQCFDKIIWYPYGVSVEKVCKTELLNTMLNIKWLILMIILTKIKKNINLNWPYIPNQNHNKD